MGLAQLHEDVVFGRTKGQIIWQPRILCWYTDKKFFGDPIPEPYNDMTLPEIYRALGCSDRLYQWYNPCFRRVEHPSVEKIEHQWSETDVETTIATPIGKQVMVNRFSPNSPLPYPLKWEVESKEELKVATWREENTTWLWDQEHYDQCQQEVGDLGAPTIYMPRMNLQSLYIEKMGVENTVYALFEWKDLVEAYFRALEQSHERLMDVINASPIKIINFGENLHASTMSPKLFEEYHLPACQRRCEKLHAAGKFVSSHWDGDCKPLLPYVKDTGLDGIEAITPVPQGDVTLEEIKQALGNELFLLDGIPAIYFDTTYSVNTLSECVHKLMELFDPRLVLGISDELSSIGVIERVRMVGEMVKAYNSQFD